MTRIGDGTAGHGHETRKNKVACRLRSPNSRRQRDPCFILLDGPTAHRTTELLGRRLEKKGAERQTGTGSSDATQVGVPSDSKASVPTKTQVRILPPWGGHSDDHVVVATLPPSTQIGPHTSSRSRSLFRPHTSLETVRSEAGGLAVLLSLLRVTANPLHPGKLSGA
jgi:hypothetical protein